jgi:hypothetical protein
VQVLTSQSVLLGVETMLHGAVRLPANTRVVLVLGLRVSSFRPFVDEDNVVIGTPPHNVQFGVRRDIGLIGKDLRS